MPTTSTSDRATLARINRLLSAEGLAVRKCRKKDPRHPELGDYYLADGNNVLEPSINLAAFEKKRRDMLRELSLMMYRDDLKRLTYGIGIDSFNRMVSLLNSRPYARHSEDYWGVWFEALGDAWSSCDGIGRYRDTLWFLFFGHPEARRKFTPAEDREVFDKLPERVTVFRGCGPDNRLGFSWSLDREVAERFPFLSRYRQAHPLLLEASVPKSRVFGYLSDRQEQEIVADVREEDIVREGTAIDRIAEQAAETKEAA